MIAIDTNVLITFLARRSEPDYSRVAAILMNEEIYVAPTVWMETDWVLRSRYKAPRREAAEAIRDIADLPNVSTDASVIAAIDWALETGMEFADALHLASCAGADSFFTLDRDLIRRASQCDGATPIYSSKAREI